MNSKKYQQYLFTIFAVLLPVFILILIEISIGLVWESADDTDLIIDDPFMSRYYSVNQTTGKRYFGEKGFGSFGTQDSFLKIKPENGFRIFVLGGSSTAGYPYLFSGSFSAMLRSRMALLYPEKTIEIINLGMTAVNSYTVRDFALELSDYEPDAFVIYAGHNEFYGALGSGSSQGKLLKANRFLTTSLIVLKKTNTYRLILYISGKLFPKRGSGQTLMARMVGNSDIAMADPIYFKTINNCIDNFRDILDFAENNGIKVFIGSLASNLRDQKPFVSTLQNDNDSTAVLSSIHSIKETMINGQFSYALWRLDSLIRIHPHYALSHFYAGRCAEFLNDTSRALNEYKLARDYDGLRFRTSSDLNIEIQNLCDDYTQCYYVPIEESLIQNSPKNITGYNFFLEHLHPNVNGNYLIAKTFSERISNIFSTNNKITAQDEDRLLSHIGITQLDSIMAGMRIQMLTSGWPFHHSNRFLTVDQIKPKNHIEALALKVLKKETDYEKAHVELAQYFLKNGNWKDAVKEYDVLSQTFRNNESPSIAASKILINNARFDEALPYLKHTLSLVNDGFSQKWLGTILLNNGQSNGALPYLKLAEKQFPNDTQVLYNLSGAYFYSGDTSMAMQTLHKLLTVSPNNTAAKDFLHQLEMISP